MTLLAILAGWLAVIALVLAFMAGASRTGAAMDAEIDAVVGGKG